MSGEELALLITAVANSAAKCLEVKDLEILAVVFTQLADTFATLAVIRSLAEENSANNEKTPKA